LLILHSNPLRRIFTERKKRGLHLGHALAGVKIDYVDCVCADLRATRFEDSCLRGCDFSNTDLHGAWCVRCDLRAMRVRGRKLADNLFVENWLVGAVGFSAEQRKYVEERGGSFLRVLDPRASQVTNAMPASAQTRRRP
jgi:hypothetical protein